MTVIVGANYDGVTYLGADSSASDETSIEARVENKVWIDGNWVAASCPNFRFIQLVKHYLDLDYILGPPEETTTRELVVKLVPILRRVIESEQHPIDDWTLLLGGNGVMYEIDSGYAVSSVPDYVSIGSGAEYALGSMFNYWETKHHPLDNVESAVKTAVESGCFFSITCCEPVTVLSVGE